MDGAKAWKRELDDEEFLSNGKGELGRFRGESNPRNGLEDSFLSTFLLPLMKEASLKWEPVGLSRSNVQSGDLVWSSSAAGGVGGRGLTGGGNFGGGCEGGGNGGGACLEWVNRLLSLVGLVAATFSEMDVALDGAWEGKE